VDSGHPDPQKITSSLSQAKSHVKPQFPLSSQESKNYAWHLSYPPTAIMVIEIEKNKISPGNAGAFLISQEIIALTCFFAIFCR
jgi:hypothetical protein